jgi:hypothetical protein
MQSHASAPRGLRPARFVIPLLALGLCGGPADAQQPARPPAVQVALCLDTSSSMEGLIDSARRRLWDVVNDLAKARPAPDLRVALFSYGNNAYDPKAGWVRQELGLTADLDRVSEKLFALQATRVAGGDEYVARVCRDAVERLAWSDDPKALRVIFVCGNESAEQDPQVKLPAVAEAAVRKGIVVNAIYCGGAPDPLAAAWREFARLGEGRFAAVDPGRGAVAAAAPQDKELTALGARLNATFCFTGKDAEALAENQRRQDANALRLGDGAAASRAESKAGGLYRFEGQDLVGRLQQDPRFDVKKVPAQELPERLKRMTPEEREKHVRGLLVQREELQKQINELARQREAHLEAERKKNPNAADRAFDEAVRGALREQAKGKGIEVPR